MPHEYRGMVVGEFHCEENFHSHWYPRVVELETVSVPETETFDLESGEPTYSEIVATMESQGWEQAFIRSNNFSDKVNPRKGSKINQPDEREARRTFEMLANHHRNHMDAPLGGEVVVREWLDLDYCSEQHCQNWHPTEVRYLIRNGRIEAAFPQTETIEALNTAHNCTYNYVERKLVENKIEPPTEQVLAVAEEFREYAWHVDFCLTTNLEWYCIDMGLNGVYWDEDKNEWTVMTGQEETLENQLKRCANDSIPPL